RTRLRCRATRPARSRVEISVWESSPYDPVRPTQTVWNSARSVPISSFSSRSDHTLKASKKVSKSINLPLGLIGELKLCQKQYAKHYDSIQSASYACFSIERRNHIRCRLISSRESRRETTIHRYTCEFEYWCGYQGIRPVNEAHKTVTLAKIVSRTKI